ncbi:MAG: Gfo/Idh/MocA family oxidoreductase [Anaerolineae bacterium]|nr:Gfo/Idh/MocA family oxidoreductase [Anaerolineae bacterium]
MIKVGVVGMGGMGWNHVSQYVKLPGVQVMAIADAVPERLEAREKVKINLDGVGTPIDFPHVARYPGAEALIAGADVDVVDICLPTDLHAPYAVQALESGRHVLCEKPMALTAADADRMIAAARAAGRQLMVAHCLRFWPEYRFLRQCIADRRYGRLLSLNMWRMGGHPGWAARNWFADPARSGGMAMDLHIHDVDYVNAVFGLPDRIYATARKSERSQAPDVLHACFEYDDGPQVHMHAGWCAAQIPFEAGFEAWFDRAMLVYDEWKLTLFDDPEHVAGNPVTVNPGDAYLDEIAYFLRCVETGTPPDECLPESTRASVALVEEELRGALH